MTCLLSLDRSRDLDTLDFLGLKALVAFDQVVLDLLAVLERSEAVAEDLAEVDEHVLTFGADVKP